MIETTGLRKSFHTKHRGKTTTVDAVAGIDLTVAEGEIFGFLGPNGAGKTTTLRMLATLIPPDGGEATIAGANLRTRLCDRVAIIDFGGIVAEGTPDGLKRARRRSRRSCGPSTPPASNWPPSNCTGPASTTCTSPGPAARCGSPERIAREHRLCSSSRRGIMVPA